ncbi:MAG: hypothetical protein V7607_3773 [Solirubrobacteraceae bacterium]
MVVALIALFIALGGPAEAKKVIDGKLLKRNSVTGRAIKNGSVAKADLSKSAVRSLERTPPNSVRSEQVADGQVLAPDIGAGAVTSTALAAGSVTSSKLAADSIGSGSVANGSLQTLDIGSFTGAVQIDFDPFVPSDNPDLDRHCQAASAPAAAIGGQPNIGDDVIVVTPPSSWPETITVLGKPSANNTIRIVACWTGAGITPPQTPPDPGPTVFRYVTFDSP